MTTITVSYSRAESRHFVVGAVTETDDYDANNGIPATLWDAGKKLIRRALADGCLLDTRGARYEHGDYAVVVESVR